MDTAGKKYDVVVLGGGPGGYSAAIRAAQSGKSVALVEAAELGGTCLNSGCVPSKALIASGEALHKIRNAQKFGVKVENISFDYSAMNDRKDDIVYQVRKNIEDLITANKIDLIRGYGRFLTPHQISVTGSDACVISADSTIIATGSNARNMAAFPFDEERIHSSTSILELDQLPKSLVIIGGGVIGCEFASLYQILGVEVILLEALDEILPLQCEAISRTLHKALERKGIRVVTNVAVQRIEDSKEGIKVHCNRDLTFEVEMALVAVGRVRNTGDIGLDKAGVVVTERGEVLTDDEMRTNVPHIYAVGDVTRDWWLAHVASHQGLVAASNAIGKPARMHYNAVPAIIFTQPEIATVGMSLKAALDAGYQATAGAFPFEFLGKSLLSNETEGFAQMVTDRVTGKILGAQVIGHEAASLVAEMAMAISNDLTIESFTETIHAHPSTAEAWLETAFLVSDQPLHHHKKIKTKTLHTHEATV